MTATRRAATALLAVRQRTWILAITVLVAANIALYFTEWGWCERGFCVLPVPGTRSEVVVGWYDGYLDIFGQTRPTH